MLKIEHVCKTFNAGTVNEKKALKGLNLHLKPGDFVIAYPEDAHMGCIAVNEPMPIIKMIAKMTAEKI